MAESNEINIVRETLAVAEAVAPPSPWKRLIWEVFAPLVVAAIVVIARHFPDLLLAWNKAASGGVPADPEKMIGTSSPIPMTEEGAVLHQTPPKDNL